MGTWPFCQISRGKQWEEEIGDPYGSGELSQVWAKNLRGSGVKSHSHSHLIK